MFNCCVVIPLPMHDEDVYCVSAGGASDAQTTLTSQLQACLTKHSTVKEKGVPLADVILQFEGEQSGVHEEQGLEAARV